jgi:hypothetical protein
MFCWVSKKHVTKLYVAFLQLNKRSVDIYHSAKLPKNVFVCLFVCLFVCFWQKDCENVICRIVNLSQRLSCCFVHMFCFVFCESLTYYNRCLCSYFLYVCVIFFMLALQFVGVILWPKLILLAWKKNEIRVHTIYNWVERFMYHICTLDAFSL